jgi:inorganic pyrophosphatase
MPRMPHPFVDLPAFDPETDHLNVIIETPKGCRNKYKYDVKRNVFMLSKVLPAGNTFPYDFGYIPCTESEDGDPLDVLILMDEAAFSGCLIPARLIGVIRAEQQDKQSKTRNDRLIAVAAESHDQKDIRSLDELNPHLLEEIEHFFVSYHEMDGKQFMPEARLGPSKARKIVIEGLKSQKSSNNNHSSKAKTRAKK